MSAEAIWPAHMEAVRRGDRDEMSDVRNEFVTADGEHPDTPAAASPARMIWQDSSSRDQSPRSRSASFTTSARAA